MPTTDMNIMFSFYLTIIIGIVSLICFIMCIVLMGKMNKLNTFVNSVLSDDALLDYIDSVRQQTAEQTFTELNPNVFCKSAVVKFNAYDDITGEYSFSLALLDAQDNGIILSSLYGHNSCNTYIREVDNGTCDTFLLEEEKQALENALNGKDEQIDETA